MNSYLVLILCGLWSTGVSISTDSVTRTMDQAVECLDYSIVYLNGDGKRKLVPGDLVYGDCTGCTVDVVGDEYQDTVDCRLAGKRISVLINRPGIQQPIFCHTIVEDNVPPVFAACPDITVGCHIDLATSHPDSFGIVVYDSCGIDSLFPIICGAEAGDCQTIVKTLKVQWQAVDKNGNISNCTQFVSYSKASLGDVTYSTEDTVYCEDPDYSEVGVPMLYDSIPITPLCGLVVNSKIVQTLQTCGPQQWIVREWTVLDPCTFDSYTSVQTIYVLDSVPPILDCTSDDTLYTNPLSCIVDYVLPRLDTLIEHNCDELDATAQSTFFVDGQIYAPGITVSLDTGIHHIQFIAADLCWNMDTCSYFVTVLDTVGPIALLCPADDSHVSDYIVGLSCTALNDSFGEPMFFADCCGIDTVICILIDSSGSFLDPRVIRQWIAIDSCGLQSDTCTQVLTIMTISRNQSVFDRSSRRELETRADGAMLHNLRMDANHNQDLKIMPNPWRANVIMELLSSTSEAAVMSITNQQGQSILRQQVELKKGVNQLALDPGSISWPAGVYWIRIQSSSEVYAGKMLHTY